MTTVLPSASRRRSAIFDAIESLEARRLFADLGLSTRMTYPLIGIDSNAGTSNVVSYDKTTGILDFRATGARIYSSPSSSQSISPAADLRMQIRVDANGNLIGGVDGVDDLVLSNDPDGPGGNAPVVLIRGEVRPGGFAADTDFGSVEAIFQTLGGAYANQFQINGQQADIGLQAAVDPAPFSFADSFSNLLAKGNLGAVQAPPSGGSQSTLSGYVYTDCNCDGIRQPGETPIAGASVSLYSGNTLISTVQTDATGKYTFAPLPPGVYKIVETQPAGFIDGKDTVGTGTAVAGTSAGNDAFNVTLGGGENAVEYNFGETRPSSVEGYVWADFNDDGKIDFNEGGIGCVTVTLYKLQGNCYVKVATQQSDASGHYAFGNLGCGTYAITECQPCGFEDGKEALGTVNGVANGSANCGYFSNVTLGCGSVGVDYDFGERPVAGCGIRCGDTGSVCFYASKTGKALLTCLNGSSSALQLGNWLASTFPNLYGATSGGKSLAGKTNAQVYDAFIAKVNSSSLKLDAQVMALALSVYVTSTDLAGTVASKYGFKVSEFGVGARTFSISGCCSSVLVMDLLLGTDDASCGGNLLGGNKCLKDYALCIFTSINECGDSH